MPTLYDHDFHAWALAQAEALRRAAELRINLPGVDIEHLAEEIEDMGNEQANAVESHLTRIIEHLLKLQYSPSPLPRRKWRNTVATQRTQMTRRLRKNRSLARPDAVADMMADAWEAGRRLAVMGLETYGERAAAIPLECPYTFEQVADFDWWPASPDQSNPQE